jgi:hypothetical protein
MTEARRRPGKDGAAPNGAPASNGSAPHDDEFVAPRAPWFPEAVIGRMYALLLGVVEALAASGPARYLWKTSPVQWAYGMASCSHGVFFQARVAWLTSSGSLLVPRAGGRGMPMRTHASMGAWRAQTQWANLQGPQGATTPTN